MPTDDDKPTATDEAKPAADKDVSTKAAAVAAVQDKINAAAKKWLEERFGFREDAEGTLHLPEQAARGDIAQRTEQFLKGFARTVAEMAPVGPAEARKPEEVPDAGQAIGQFLSKMGNAVSDAVQGYLRRNAVDPQHPERPVAINGPFVVRHGVPLITEIVRSLGGAFEEPRTGAQGGPAPVAATPTPAPKREVEVEIELPKLLKQLAEDFASGGKTAPAPAPAPPPPTPAADASEPKKDP